MGAIKKRQTEEENLESQDKPWEFQHLSMGQKRKKESSQTKMTQQNNNGLLTDLVAKHGLIKHIKVYLERRVISIMQLKNYVRRALKLVYLFGNRKFTDNFTRIGGKPWPVCSVGWSIIPCTRKLPVGSLVRALTWVSGSNPGLGTYRRQLTNVFLSH